MAAFQELLHLGPCRTDAGQDGEDGLAALANLLVEHVIHLENLHQSWCAEDHHDGVDVVGLLAVVDGDAQVLCPTRCQDVDGVGHAAARQELRLQLIGHLGREWRHRHATLRQRIGEHHARASGVGDDGKAMQRGRGLQREDTPHRRQLLPAIATHDTCLAEEGLDGAVTRCDGTRMT